MYESDINIKIECYIFILCVMWLANQCYNIHSLAITALDSALVSVYHNHTYPYSLYNYVAAIKRLKVKKK